MVAEMLCKDCPHSERIPGYTIELTDEPKSTLIVPDYLKRNCEGIPVKKQFVHNTGKCISATVKSS